MNGGNGKAVRELQPLGVGINLLPHAARVLHDLGMEELLAELAILDAECLAEHLSAAESVTLALERYEAIRRPATARIVQMNRANGPEQVMQLAEERAPAGFTDIETLRCDDRAVIEVHNVGVRGGPTEILARLGRGESVDPAAYYFRTTPRFLTGDARYRWINDLIAVGSALRRADAVVLDFYVVQ